MEKNVTTDKKFDTDKLYISNFKLSNIGMAVVDLNGDFLMVNEAWAEILGYEKEKLEKLNVIDITYPEDKEKSKKCLQDVRSGKKEQANFEKRYISADGEIVWAHLNYVLVKENNIPLYFATQMVMTL